MKNDYRNYPSRRKDLHQFEIVDKNNLTNKEVSSVFNSMSVKAIFGNGKYYEN
ncbi:hypothetical protein [Winogradskyella helgolandensis]|uniref:hypothetical protein n=1 Tax=Winogradskyella helgolandensis TaxID=2697010 RepID=UPI0015BA11BD|nr:hypothetical protein [Winogradskyella helgolandensis]